MLFVFEKVDLQVLDKLCLVFQKAMSDFKLSPFILTSSEIVPSSDVFAVKLFDIQKHHLLLSGKDYLRQLTFERNYLKFISEQELRNQLSRMKFFYIQNFNLPEQLLMKIQKGFTTLLINANTFLYLKTGAYYATRKQIVDNLMQSGEMDATVLKSLLLLKENPEQQTPESIKEAYTALMLQYKQLIQLYNNIQ